jgi:hypothetical protein
VRKKKLCKELKESGLKLCVFILETGNRVRALNRYGVYYYALTSVWRALVQLMFCASS